MPRPTSKPLSLLLAELTVSSFETIARRSLMMAEGSCSFAEYARMVQEKMLAAQRTGVALMTGADVNALLRPWHTGARRNASRLRRKR